MLLSQQKWQRQEEKAWVRRFNWRIRLKVKRTLHQEGKQRPPLYTEESSQSSREVFISFSETVCTHSQHRSIFGVGKKNSNSMWNNNKFFLQSLGLKISLVALDPFPITVIKYTHKSSPREEGAVSATAQCAVHHNRKVEAAGDGSSCLCIIWIRKHECRLLLRSLSPFSRF